MGVISSKTCLPTQSASFLEDDPALNRATIYDLPDMVLVQIFSLLSVEDLAVGVRYVCKRWQTISQDREIWKGKSYCPNVSKSKDTELGANKALLVLKNSPKLEKFQADYDFPDPDILEAVTKYSKKITKLELMVDGTTHCAVKHLIISKYLSIQELHLYFPTCEWSDDEIIVRNNTEGILEAIEEISNLRLLVLYGYGLQVFSVPSFQNISKNLERLVLHHIDHYISEDLIVGFETSTFAKLISLDLTYCRCVENELLQAIFEMCNSLKYLRITDCSPMTEDAFEFMNTAESLTDFCLEDCAHLEGCKIIPHLVKCQHLESLYILHIAGLNKNEVMECMEKMPALRIMRVEGSCPTGRFVTDVHCP